MIEKLIELLGEDNTKKLEDGITEIILEQIKDDFGQYTLYLLDPDAVQAFVEECKAKAFDNIRNKTIKDMEEKIKHAINS